MNERQSVDLFQFLDAVTTNENTEIGHAAVESDNERTDDQRTDDQRIEDQRTENATVDSAVSDTHGLVQPSTAINSKDDKHSTTATSENNGDTHRDHNTAFGFDDSTASDEQLKSHPDPLPPSGLCSGPLATDADNDSYVQIDGADDDATSDDVVAQTTEESAGAHKYHAAVMVDYDSAAFALEAARYVTTEHHADVAVESFPFVCGKVEQASVCTLLACLTQLILVVVNLYCSTTG